MCIHKYVYVVYMTITQISSSCVIYLCACVFVCKCMCIAHVHACVGALTGEKRVADSLELDFEVDGSY